MPRRRKSQEAVRTEGVHAMWELPYLMQFLHLHRPKFKFIKLSMKELEGSIINNDSLVLPDILTRLLRFLDNDQSILISNFEAHLCKLLNEKKKDNSLLSSGKLSDLKPDDKVQILRWLIDYVTDEKNDDLTDTLNDSFSSDDMRAINVGQDAFGNTYWYFDDLRLYKESASIKGSRKEWDCISVSLNDWHLFLNKYKKSSNPAEKELYEYLHNELFPVIEPLLVKQEKGGFNDKNTDLDREAILNKEKIDTEGMIKKETSVELVLPEVKLEPITNGNDTPKDGSTEETNIGSVKSEPHSLPDEKPPPSVGDGVMPQIPDKKPLVKGGHPNQTAPFNITNTHHMSGRTPTSMDAPFMQQQSQIFVFSTSLANKAAESVIRGQFKSIIAYHLEEPGTKKFLQKHPLKISQFNRPPGFPMLTNSRNPSPHMGPGNRPMGPWPPDQQGMPPGGGGMNSNNAGMPMNPNMPNPNMMQGWPGQGPQNAMMAQQYAMMGNPQMGPHGPPGSHMNLSQTKVPNENLTPEQLQRREEHLASLRKIHQMLFPEQVQEHGMPGHPQGMPGGPHPNSGMPMGPQGMPGMPNMSPNQGNMMSRGNYMMGPHGQMMSGTPPQLSPQELQSLPPAQREWYRLQHEFYHEKRRHMAMAAQNNPYFQNNPMNMNSPNSSGQGPPPSYFSSMAQKRCGPPGSLSPTSPGFNGPMSSPHGPMPSPHLSSTHPSPVPGESHFPFPSQKRPPSQPYPPMGQSPGMVGSPGYNHNMPGQNMMPFNDPMMRPLGPNQEGFVQKASSPEVFLDPSANNIVGAKPPPSYGQATKRRKLEQVPAPEEMQKNLQPTPSPQQINYLQQFEGQELTITKQVNMAFQDGGSGPPGGPDMCSLASNVVPNMINKNSTAPSTPSSVMSPGHVQPHTPSGPSTPNPISQKMPTNHLPGQVTPEIALSSPNQMPKSGHGGMSSSSGMPSPFSPSVGPGRTPTVSKSASQHPTPSPVHHGQMPSPAQVPTPGSVQRSNTSHNGPSTPLAPGSQMSSAERSNQGQLPVTSPMSNQSQMSINSPCPVSSASQRSSTDSLSNVSQGPGNQMSRPPSITGGTQRLSHYDPPSSNSAPGTPLTPTTKSATMSNITSASLANLAKGVEHLSNQMQQNMMQGGPFHNIQIQGQVTEKGVASPQQQQQQSPLAGLTQSQPSQPPISNTPPLQQTPSVNNTYVNATMSIQQLNIQSVNNPNVTASMQAQQQNSEMGMNMPVTSNNAMNSVSQMQSQSVTVPHGLGPQQSAMMQQQKMMSQQMGNPQGMHPHHMSSQHQHMNNPQFSAQQMSSQQQQQQQMARQQMQQMSGQQMANNAQQMASQQQMNAQQMANKAQQMAAEQQLRARQMANNTHQMHPHQQMSSQHLSAQQMANNAQIIASEQQMRAQQMAQNAQQMASQQQQMNAQQFGGLPMNHPMNSPPMPGQSLSGPGMGPQSHIPGQPQFENPAMPCGQQPNHHHSHMAPMGNSQMNDFQGPSMPNPLHSPHQLHSPHSNSQSVMQQMQSMMTSQSQPMSRSSQSTASVGNANVQIQSKAPNTIQYLPANPPTSQPSRFPPKLPDFDTSFGNPAMDVKQPSSKLQYFPNNDGQNSLPPMNRMPGMPMSGPSPNQTMGMQEAAMMGSRMSHSRMSPMQYHPRLMHPGAQGGYPQSGNSQGMPMGPGNPGMMGNQMDFPGPGGPMDPSGMMTGNNMNSMGQHVQIQGQQMTMQGPMNIPQNAGQMDGPGYRMSPRPNQPNYNMQYQQFQQQLYAQNRTSQMNPQMGSMGPMNMNPHFPNMM